MIRTESHKANTEDREGFTKITSGGLIHQIENDYHTGARSRRETMYIHIIQLCHVASLFEKKACRVCGVLVLFTHVICICHSHLCVSYNGVRAWFKGRVRAFTIKRLLENKY